MKVKSVVVAKRRRRVDARRVTARGIGPMKVKVAVAARGPRKDLGAGQRGNRCSDCRGAHEPAIQTSSARPKVQLSQALSLRCPDAEFNASWDCGILFRSAYR